MKRVLVLTLRVLLLAASTAAAASTLTLEPPPGWSDAGAVGKVPGVVIALQGPQLSSFIVKRTSAAPLDNPAGARGYLVDVLAGLRDAGRRNYRSSGRVETRLFRNGLTASLLRAQLGSEDRLVLGLFEVGGVAYLVVLLSAAPEAMLPLLLGALNLGAASGEVSASGVAPAAPVARSLDGQLEIALGGGLRSRALLGAERAQGFVLAVLGAGSEVIFQKLSDGESTKPAEQSAIVRELAGVSAGVAADKASPVRAAPSAAGPVGVYSWAGVPGSPGMRLAAGYLPWCYWGYQLFGRGPSADELLVGALAALKLGPSAVPGLVAASPRIPLSDAAPPRRLLWVAAAAVLAAALLRMWRRWRKNANLSA